MNKIVLALLLVAGTASAQAPAITDAQITPVVNSHMSEIKGCAQKHGLPTGKLVVYFVVEPDGHVKQSKPQEHSSSPTFDACVAKLFTGWTFPKPKGGAAAEALHPFLFAAAKPKAPVEGKLDQAVIVSTVKSKNGEINACYDAAMKEKKGDEPIVGTVNVAMVISAEGRITESKVKDTTTQAPKLDACIVEKVKTWTFPKPNPAGEVAVIYPFIFDPKKAAGGASKHQQ